MAPSRNETWMKEPCMLGIDEAGRGPVLGPMVYGCAVSLVDKDDMLKEMQMDDSKVLSEEKRDEIFASIKASEDISYKVHVLLPQELSAKMLRINKYNLNAISHDTAIGLIKSYLEDGYNIQKVFVDTVGMPEKYQAKLEGIFPSLNITVAKKADSLYPIVSAASICAKVTRDKVLREWEFLETGLEPSRSFGSGYPSDPATKKWLDQNLDPVFGFPNLVRFSWGGHSKDILEKRGVAVDWHDEDDDGGPKCQDIRRLAKRPRCLYFEQRNLAPVTSF
eukprot:Rmarinus@m.16701